MPDGATRDCDYGRVDASDSIDLLWSTRGKASSQGALRLVEAESDAHNAQNASLLPNIALESNLAKLAGVKGSQRELDVRLYDMAVPVLILLSCGCATLQVRFTWDWIAQVTAMLLAFIIAGLRFFDDRRKAADMSRFRDENIEFRRSNEALRAELEGLSAKNRELSRTNQDLQVNVTRLDEVRQLVEAHAVQTNSDVGALLADFHQGVIEQTRIQKATKAIQQHTRKCADMEWRALLMNRYQSACQVASAERQNEPGAKPVRSLTRDEFNQFVELLPTVAWKRSGDFSFETADSDHDGLVDDRDIREWVQHAALKLVDLDVAQAAKGEAGPWQAARGLVGDAQSTANR